jgi:TRAP-type C4-dicarboxylate transport system permease large subunit
MPSVRAMGVDDMQFAMIFILAGNLSLITPPVGIILFVACRIGNIPVWSMFKAVFPFLIAEALVIVILILVPELSTALPSLRH